MAFTRSRAYRKNDNAHAEQKNYTQVRQWFGYERYDNSAVWPLMDTLCDGALNQLLNCFLPTMKLEPTVSIGRLCAQLRGVYGISLNSTQEKLRAVSASNPGVLS